MCATNVTTGLCLGRRLVCARACGWECGARTCGGRTCWPNVRQEWDKDDGSSLEDKVKSLHQHDVPAVLVSVKLVGLQAGSVESGGFAVDDRLLRRHLQSVARDRMHQLHALHTEFRADEPHAGGPSTTDHSHDFFVKRKFSFVVSHASRCATGCAHLVCGCVGGCKPSAWLCCHRALTRKVLSLIRDTVVEQQKHVVRDLLIHALSPRC